MSQCSRHSQCVTTDLHTTRFSLNYKIYFKLAAISAFWEKYMIKQNSFRKRKRKRERIHLELVKWQVHSIGRRTNASSKCRETGRARTGGKAINSDPSVPKTSLRILHSAVYIYFLWYWPEEFVSQLGAFLVGDHFLYSHDLSAWFSNNTVRRN